MRGIAEGLIGFLCRRIEVLLALSTKGRAGRYSRFGLGLSGIYLAFSGLWISYFTVGAARWLPLTLVGLALYNIMVSLRGKISLSRANTLALTGHLTALLAFYLFSTRFLTVAYQTDGIISTYMGIIKTLQGQNPYLYSIKPFLDQFGLPPSFYTPKVDGSFEFHLNYPALSFLSLMPLYLAGLHDLRDGVLFFHILSILAVFYFAPPKLKALSIAVFALGFPSSILYSYTDSVWAFFLIMSALYWKRDRKVSLVMFGLAGATKQIAFAALPFLLVALWRETEGSRLKGLLKGASLILATYLVPNLPFLLSSPSSWWSATVDPYLPGATPMIAGGIGFSGILMDLGVALPTQFFTLLMGAVGVASIALFFLRYRQVRHLMWGMPALALFFYHRSFPNYLFYWVFPLLVEQLLRGSLNPGLDSVLRLGFLVRRPLGGPILGSFKRRTWPAVMLALVIASAFAGASGAYVSQFSRSTGEVRVNSVADPDSLGVATTLNVSLTNAGSVPISPRFFVKPSCPCLPLLWKSTANATLTGSSQASYLVVATDANAGIPRATQFRVLVYDSKTGDLVGQSKLLSADIPRPSVANPGFRWWILDASSGKQVPYGWRLSPAGIQEPLGGIGPFNRTLDSGIQMRLNYSSFAGPSRVAITQRLLFNETKLSLLAYQSFTNNPPGSAVLGAEVNDNTHHVFFLFSSIATVETVASYSENVTVTVAIRPFAWSTLVLDPQAIWKAQGWAEPNTVELSLYLQTSFFGYYFENIKEMSRS